MVQNHLSFADASETYTRLTVGDGLVSQIPALIVSVAAGILVSKAGMTDSTDKVLFEQVANYPKALGMSAFWLWRWECSPERRPFRLCFWLH